MFVPPFVWAKTNWLRDANSREAYAIGWGQAQVTEGKEACINAHKRMFAGNKVCVCVQSSNLLSEAT